MAGFRCEGYSEPSYTWIVRSSSSQNPHQPVQRRDSGGSQLSPAHGQAVSSVDPSAPSISGEPFPAQPISFTAAPSSPYQTVDEQRAHKIYFEHLLPIMIQFSDPHCWLVTIPRMALRQPTVRNALIAVSLVAIVSNRETPRTRCSPRRHGYGENDIALGYLNATVRSMADGLSPVDVALTVGVLLFTLETFMHQVSIAMVHLKSAVAILGEYQQRIAEGERVDGSDTEAIDHVGSVIQIAVKMAEGFIAAHENVPKIDYNTPEAFETRQRLTRQGVTDSVQDIVDARNILGAISVKVVSLRHRICNDRRGTSDNSHGPGVGEENSLAEQLETNEKLLQHFDRLFAPIYDERNLECQYMAAHRKTLYMIVQDMGGDVSRAGATSDLRVNDRLLFNTMSLAANDALMTSPVFRSELGLIPPILYMAVNSQRCSVPARRAAANFLMHNLGPRVEGRWNGETAGRIAQEIINAGADAGSDLDIVVNSFEEFHSLPAPSAIANEQHEKPGLWLSYFRLPRRHPEDRQTHLRSPDARATAQPTWRRCSSWTQEEIQTLQPEPLNEFVTSCGYQGYFEDAVHSAAVF